LILFARNLGHSWILHSRELILRTALKGLKAKLVIDVGCADGGYLPLLSTYLNTPLVIGVDVSQKELRLSKLYETCPNSAYAQADVTALPFSTSTFDIIFSKDLLHHLSYPSKALKEFRRVLKSNGTMVIIEADRDNPLMRMYIGHGHNHYTLKQLSALMERTELNGFRVEQVTAYPHHFLFWSGKPMELIWDLYIMIFLSFCYGFPSVATYLVKLVSSTTPYSYNIILWKRKH